MLIDDYAATLKAFIAKYQPVAVVCDAGAIGKDIVSAQWNFDPDDLSYVQQRWIHLDHDQRWTASAGASYRVWYRSTHPLMLSGTHSLESTAARLSLSAAALNRASTRASAATVTFSATAT